LLKNKQQILIEKIVNCFNLDRVLYSGHARHEMQIDEFGSIKDQEVYEAIQDGVIIKEYPDDKPYPSTLIFGKANLERPLHIVCAYDSEENQTIVITVYQPDPERWEDYQRRKK
jgi:hypothetical protein